MRILSHTFARHLCDCLTSVVRIFMCHELVANWSRMFYTCFKILCEFFNQNISQECCESVSNLSPRNFGKLNFTMQNFRDTCTNVLRVSHDSCTTVLRKHAKLAQQSGEKIKLSDIRTNVMRHSHKCCVTVVRIKMKISYIRGKVM